MDAENANLVEAGFASSPQLPQTQLIDKGEGSSQLPGMTHSACCVVHTAATRLPEQEGPYCAQLFS
jgi:hypothetical protein